MSSSPGRLTPSKPSPSGTDRLSVVPDVIMYSILSHLPDDAVDILAKTSRGMERTQVLGEKYYWSNKLAKFLDMESIPPEALVGVDPKKAYKESAKCGNIVSHAKRGHADAVAILLALGLCTPQEEQAGLTTAINHGIEEVIAVYIDKERIGTSTKWWQLFMEACSKGMANTVSILSGSAKISAKDRGEGLLRALDTTNHDQANSIVGLLLETVIEPTRAINLALVKASRKGHVDSVVLLLKKEGVNPRYNNSEALREAVAYNEIDIVKLLLQDGRSNPYANDNEALATASRLRHGAPIATLLREHKARATTAQ